MPPLDGEDLWKLTVKQKKDMYGKHRIAIGGPSPEDADEREKGALLQVRALSVQGRRSDSTIEPAFYHAGPALLMDEILHDFSVAAVNDLTPGQLCEWL